MPGSLVYYLSDASVVSLAYLHGLRLCRYNTCSVSRCWDYGFGWFLYLRFKCVYWNRFLGTWQVIGHSYILVHKPIFIYLFKPLKNFLFKLCLSSTISTNCSILPTTSFLTGVLAFLASSRIGANFSSRSSTNGRAAIFTSSKVSAASSYKSFPTFTYSSEA